MNMQNIRFSIGKRANDIKDSILEVFVNRNWPMSAVQPLCCNVNCKLNLLLKFRSAHQTSKIKKRSSHTVSQFIIKIMTFQIDIGQYGFFQHKNMPEIISNTACFQYWVNTTLTYRSVISFWRLAYRFPNLRKTYNFVF